MDLDIEYENRAFIPGGDDYPPMWEARAREFREVEAAVGRARLNQPYGPDSRQRFDLFYPAGRPLGLVVFVHGGYWIRFDRKDFSHLAAGATAAGWAVAMPSYSLAPTRRISEITREVASALRAAAAIIPGPIVVTGHSAGGHLAARMACSDVGLDADVVSRMRRCLPISPLTDLRPLIGLTMNADFRLDDAEAAAESPRLRTPRPGLEVTVWVGAEERPAFLDQARWLADAWPEARLVVAPGRHHFDVIEELEDQDSRMLRLLLGGL